jgi:hypothetical protein
MMDEMYRPMVLIEVTTAQALIPPRTTVLSSPNRRQAKPRRGENRNFRVSDHLRHDTHNTSCCAGRRRAVIHFRRFSARMFLEAPERLHFIASDIKSNSRAVAAGKDVARMAATTGNDLLWELREEISVRAREVVRARSWWPLRFGGLVMSTSCKTSACVA